ncbi:hypothetical protein NKR23_g6860 [Pleurostoma richardsiae]|uniref:Uncharacterized protein n=1 Tax=Pleurostoma richardsiae TaxID=41990 RepID=A0AA38RA06_9PEZI|nr:hypothetical protein NKR23_g6860 [Pleurostoma richardsiae]
MALTRLLTIATLFASTSSSPIILRDGIEDERLSYNPGGPLIPATDAGVVPPPTPLSYLPGGPLIPDDTIPGGPMLPATDAESVSLIPETYVLGGPMIPDSTAIRGGSIDPRRRDDRLPFYPGGPMITHLPVLTATPTPMPFIPGGPMTPDPFIPGGPMKPPPRRNPCPDTAASPIIATPSIESCTVTISEHSPASVICRWDRTQTVYPSTTTAYKSVDCHGCADVYVHYDMYFCPMQKIDAVTTVATPSTHWSTVCEPLVTALGERVEERREGDGGNVYAYAAACPTTYVVQPRQTAGATLTQYQRTVTVTQRLGCGAGCSQLVVSTALAGYGPAGRFTKKTTAPVETSTTYMCG